MHHHNGNRRWWHCLLSDDLKKLRLNKGQMPKNLSLQAGQKSAVAMHRARVAEGVEFRVGVGDGLCRGRAWGEA